MYLAALFQHAFAIWFQGLARNAYTSLDISPANMVSFLNSTAAFGAAAGAAANDTLALRAILDRQSARDESRIAQLFAQYRCRHVYLDVGTNVGVQIRKLFEPALYPKAQASHEVFERFFGSPRERCQVCAIGVEPNPHHRMRLSALQRVCASTGSEPVPLSSSEP